MEGPDRLAAARMVGRDRAFAELSALLEEARVGRGGAALVRGDAGMGKTTLIGEVDAAADAAGFATVWGWCPSGQALPYLPWRPVLRHLGVTDPADPIGKSSGNEELGRQRMFAAVLDGLEASARRNPILVVIEDLHWADPPSLALLRAVAEGLRKLPVCLLGTVRDDPLEVAADVASSLRELPTAVLRLTLHGLDTAGVGELLTAVTGQRPAEEVVAQVHRRTGGNPFFVTEVGRLMNDPADRVEPVPAGAREVLERRLDRLRPAVRQALRAAAVAGEPIVAAVVAAVVGDTEPPVVQCLDEAVRARLLSRAPGEPPRFSHALIGEVLATELDVGERARMHERAARALEERGNAEPGVLAYHWSRSQGGLARRRAATWSLAEARRARRGYGFEQAVAAYRRGLEAPGEDRLALLLELAEAERLAGDSVASRRSYLDAARRARQLNRPDDLAVAALGLGGGLAGFEVGLRDEEQVALLREALAALPAGDGELRAAVLARLSVALTELSPDPERITIAGDAVAMAQRVGDPAVRVAALAAYCDAVAGPAHVAERLAAAIQMRQLAESTGDVVGVLLARRLAVVALAERGELTAADAEGAAYARTAERLGVPHYRWLPPVWRGRNSLLRGDIEAALHAAAEVEELGRRAGSVNAVYMATAVRWHARRLEGTLGVHGPELFAGFAGLHDMPSAQGPIAQCALAAGDVAEARRLVRAVRDIGLNAMAHDSEWLAGVWAVAEVAMGLDDRDAAREAYETMAPFGAVFVTEGLAATILGVTDHILGRLAGFLGDAAGARQHLDAALVVHRRTASPVLITATESALADVRPPPAPVRAIEADTGKFHRAGRLWEVGYRGESAIVADSKGMVDLAALLRAPGREVHVLDLVDPTGTARATASDAGPELDATARSAYRRRLTELDDDLAAAERDGDLGRAERLRTEHEFLTAELAGALGLGGRARLAADPVERARKAVAMRIATALRGIEAVHRPLARHLRHAVITGRFCSYRPEQPVNWNL